MSPHTIGRAKTIQTLTTQLETRGFPRLQMLVFLVLAGGAAFLTSFLLLHSGVTRMAPRYGVAALVGYGVLLGCFRWWLWRVVAERTGGRPRETRDASGLDAVDMLPDAVLLPTSPPAPSVPGFGGGGGFAGGGTSRSWGDATESSSRPSLLTSRGGSSGGASSSGGDGFDLGGLDDGAVILLPIIAIVAAVVIVSSSLAVIWTAPALFAELLADGLIAAGVYRHIRRSAARHWLFGAVRRTWLAAILVLVVASAAGALIQTIRPTARSIGDVWRLPNPRVPGPVPMR